jgi:aspartyl-tRNA(Asn)/glutamyl-tRNA(Gln) amidotransferase subunit B
MLTGETFSLMDVNRSGVPLMEIVGEPDLRSPRGRRLPASAAGHSALHRRLTANMEDGAFRCDANVSLRPKGETALGAKVEVKNMNSFRAVERALAFEIARQAEVLGAGGASSQETRGWVEERGRDGLPAQQGRGHDYRYFPEPDLPPLFLSREWVEESKPACRSCRSRSGGAS